MLKLFSISAESSLSLFDILLATKSPAEEHPSVILNSSEMPESIFPLRTASLSNEVKGEITTENEPRFEIGGKII